MTIDSMTTDPMTTKSTITDLMTSDPMTTDPMTSYLMTTDTTINYIFANKFHFYEIINIPISLFIFFNTYGYATITM